MRRDRRRRRRLRKEDVWISSVPCQAKVKGQFSFKNEIIVLSHISVEGQVRCLGPFLELEFAVSHVRRS